MQAFEKQIVSELLKAAGLCLSQYPNISEQETLEFSGAGYFLTLEDPRLPEQRLVLDKPFITGKLGGIEVGYLAFVQHSQLLLECYSYDQEILPEHRNQHFLRDSYPS